MFLDAFGKEIFVGDKVATIANEGKFPILGVVLSLHKSNVKIEITATSYGRNNYGPSVGETKLIPQHRAIKVTANE